MFLTTSMDILHLVWLALVTLFVAAHLTVSIAMCLKKPKKRKNMQRPSTIRIAHKVLPESKELVKENVQEDISHKTQKKEQPPTDSKTAVALSEKETSAVDKSSSNENTVEKISESEPKNVKGVTEKDVKEVLNELPLDESTGQRNFSRLSIKTASQSKMSQSSVVQPVVFVQQSVPEVPSFTIYRDVLPAEVVSNQGMSLWGILKRSLGRDLMRISMPVHFNEPLSLLQRLAEYMEYCYLIDQALDAKDSTERLEFIGAFAASTLAALRTTKPFNPLLFETYELDRPDMGFRFIAEQVSHHPPVSAFHVTSNEYEFYGTVAPQIRLTGRLIGTIAVNPQANFTLKLKKFDECYTWQAINVNVHDIIFGPLLSYGGNQGNNCPEHLVTGEIVSGKTKLRSIYGNWTSYLASCEPTHFWDNYAELVRLYREYADLPSNADTMILIKDSQILWREFKKPPNSHKFYGFGYFTMQLNDMGYTQNSTILPRTDCRLRPDIRAMENGEIDAAESVKEQLEKNQRIKAKETQQNKQPKWFTEISKDEFGREFHWQFKGDYWNREFDDCEDIY